MKHLILLATLISTVAFGAGYGDEKDANLAVIPSGTYVLEPYHGHLTFSYMHSGWSNPSVKFEKFDLKVEIDQDDHANSSVSMTVDTSSINSGSKIFNGHLMGMYFKTEDHPKVTATAKGFTATGPATGTMTANLTIGEITQPVELDIVINAAGPHPHPMAQKAPGLGVSVSAVVDGRPWFPGARFPAPAEVHINLEAELISEEGGEVLAAAFEKIFGPRE